MHNQFILWRGRCRLKRLPQRPESSLGLKVRGKINTAIQGGCILFHQVGGLTVKGHSKAFFLCLCIFRLSDMWSDLFIPPGALCSLTFSALLRNFYLCLQVIGSTVVSPLPTKSVQMWAVTQGGRSAWNLKLGFRGTKPSLKSTLHKRSKNNCTFLKCLFLILKSFAMSWNADLLIDCKTLLSLPIS